MHDGNYLEAVAAAVHYGGPADLAYLLSRSYTRVAHTDLISRSIASACRDGTWLMVATPPQVGKTTTAIVWSAVWMLARDPKSQIIIMSYSDTFAETTGRAIRAIVEQHGPTLGISLQRGSSAAKRWHLTQGGSVLSVGLQGGITGNPCTFLLVDDYIKSREEADSSRYRAKILSNILSGGFTRRSPRAPIIWTGTLWSHLEASRVLLRRYGTTDHGGKWTNLVLPALATAADDPLGRDIGQPLTRVDQQSGRVLTPQEARDWWSEQKLGQNPRDWSALYQCDPTPDGGALMTLEDIERAFGVPPEVMVETVLAVDPSDADSLDSTGHDATGISLAGRDESGVIWGLADYTMTGPAEEWTRRVAELAARHEVDTIVYERNKGGRAVEIAIQSAWDSLRRAGHRLGVPPPIEPVTATKNKITRASPIAAMLKNGTARLARTGSAPLDTVGSQFASYQAGSADSPDEMDAFVWAATWLYEPASDNGDHGDYLEGQINLLLEGI